MATIFNDGDKVTKEWLNKVSVTNTDACCDATTPEQLRKCIGAAADGDTVEEAPSNDKIYGRKNAQWVDVDPTGTAFSHASTTGRDAADSHPQSAITGLTTHVTTVNNHIGDDGIHFKLYSGTTDPDPALGEDGDLYIKEESNARAAMTSESLHAAGLGSDGERAITVGCNAVGDGGGGVWYWDATVLESAANLGTVINPRVDYSLQGSVASEGDEQSGCWVRSINSVLTPEMWGAVGDGTTDDTAALQGMTLAANSQDYANEILFGSSERAVGETLAIQLASKAVYAVSDEIIVSTNTHIFGHGATLRMLPAGVGKTVLRLHYKIDGDTITLPSSNQYGTVFSVLQDIIIDGGGYAKYGVLLEKLNWSKVENIVVSGCVQSGGYGGYGIRLEECQYSVFTAIYVSECHSGIHIGASSAQLDLKTIDNSFIGCTFWRNTRYGIHIASGTNNVFMRCDVGRNGDTAVIIDQDNDNGEVASSVNRGNTFYNLKAEYTADDEPSSGYLINVAVSNAYNTRIVNLNVSQQNGTVNVRPAYFKWVRSVAQQVFVDDPATMQQGTTLSENPNIPGDYSIFRSESSDGLRVSFKTWAPLEADIVKLCVDATDTPIAIGSTKFTCAVDAQYFYRSQTISTP